MRERQRAEYPRLNKFMQRWNTISMAALFFNGEGKLEGGLEDASEIAVKAAEEASEAAEAGGAAETGELAEAAGRNPAQDKLLSRGEIQKLKDSGYDVHDLKPGKGTDLYKDQDGNIYVKPKGGAGPGDHTGMNINDF
jgi:hypothetical protein